ncbi:major facilitator superfamily transporter [Venturia nashicola]|uniref:Major facilitator superfamily transporter n=1 Tax=Venturia nashicola TaxID=86259 RepID=A0A4Z1NZP3_9PEZI|nr:major facilitator superfamily transporter [Venturia nashicola]TLD25990.1 major facilitator superfamily transporter [Venturia nashicola]
MDEKHAVGHVQDHEAVEKRLSHSSDDDILAEFTPEEIKKVIHRIDRRLVVTVGLMYCVSLMDRTNLSAAAIAGMNVELKLGIKNRYSIVTLVFFTSYILFEFPSTVIIRYLGPRNHLAGITVLWGAVMLGMGFVKTWSQLAALRVVLGVLEAGFFPGCVYLLSTWYTRFDMHKRYSVFYMLGSLASACAGILAYGLMQMKGLAGYAGWRWIFIIEGILTMLIGFVGYFALVGFPDDDRENFGFLTKREKRMIVARVERDRGDAHTEAFSWKKFLSAGLDLKIWGFAWIFGMSTTVSYALAYFLPIILRNGMRFSLAKSQCLVAPPYAAAGIMMYVTGYIGDKYHIRGPIIVFNSTVAIIGLPLIGWVKNVGVRYFGVFLVCMGANSNIPAAMTYQANNIRGHWKRAFCSATLVAFGGIGGIIGSLVFREHDAPQYRPGLWAAITSQLIIIVIVLGLSVKFRRDNMKVDRGEMQIEGSDQGFKYTL